MFGICKLIILNYIINYVNLCANYVTNAKKHNRDLFKEIELDLFIIK